MILKLCMKHQAIELYKVYINHDPGMTLTHLMARLTSQISQISGERLYDHWSSGLNSCHFSSTVWSFRIIFFPSEDINQACKKAEFY